MLPKRKPRKRMMPKKEDSPIRCQGHLQWVRGHECSVANGYCNGRIEAAHVRKGTDGGIGMKPSDCYVIPLCSEHHRTQHKLGEARFESVFKIRMKTIADKLWDISPHGKRYRMQKENG